MADRYAYIPLIGIFIAVAWGGAEAAERLDGQSSSRAGSSMAAAGLLAAGLLAVVTRRQVAHWHDSQALFEHALKCTTGNYIAHNMLGKVHYERGDWDKVIEQDSAAVAMNPRFAEALYDLGTALLFRDRAADAVPHLKRVIELDPSRAEAHNNLGIALMRLGEPDEALRQFAVATQLSPRYLDARYNLASSLLRSGDVDGAIEHFSKVLELDPANERARSNLQQALARKRQREPAGP
jgi:tetratricopeptide (TPR) repeat protein